MTKGNVFAIINQKGGVGKSTTAAAIGACLTKKRKKVLLIDLDAQCNLTYVLAADTTVSTIFDVINKSSKLENAIQHLTGGDIVGATPALSSADTILTMTGKEYRLKEALEVVKEMYDYIILDTPPALGILTINALTACDKIIIPAQADIFSLQGVAQLYSTIDAVRVYCNPKILIDGIVLTRFNSRAIISRNVAEMINETAKQFDTRLYDTKVRECTALKEAQILRQSIFDYAPKSNAAADYLSLVNEIIGRGKRNV